MGEARRRRVIEAVRVESATRWSEPWPCPNCSDDPGDPAFNVVYVVRDGRASCPRCGWGDRRAAFGFATFDHPPGFAASTD